MDGIVLMTLVIIAQVFITNQAHELTFIHTERFGKNSNHVELITK